ncbi:MAG: hypothetical protein AAGI51_14495 [Pseudomonadota bacterium]
MPKLPDALKFGGACFGLGAIAAGALGSWVSVLGLAALAAGFAWPMISRSSGDET